jgi:hypothetical protein
MKKSAARMLWLFKCLLSHQVTGFAQKLVQQGYKVKKQNVYLHF